MTFNHEHKLRFWFFGWREKWADHLLTAFIPKKGKIHFAVQGKQYMKPLTRFVLERLGTFSTRDIRKGINYLRKGETVAIFPQGEAHLVQKNKYYKGAAFLAQKGNTNLTPVKITAAYRRLHVSILPIIRTKGKTLEQITQEIQDTYSK